MRVIALFMACFLFFSTIEAFAWVWLAGRWFYSSRYASLSLAVVKRWLDRGLISRFTQYAKVFVNRYGKMILMTLALSEVIQELDRELSSSSVCHISYPDDNFWLYQGSSGVSAYVGGSKWPQYVSFSSTGCPYGTTVYGRGMLNIYEWSSSSGRWVSVAYIPVEGEYPYKDSEGNVVCVFRVQHLRGIGNTCPSDLTSPPQEKDLDREERRVPVRVYPNPSDFVRPDVVNSDPALSYLRDEYQRISQDTSIPDVSSDLAGVDLPQVGWDIPPEEAVDFDAETSRDSPGSGDTSIPSDSSGDQDISEDRPRDEDLPQVPGFDTSLNVPEKRSFPVELLNSLIQSHPLLRVLRGVSLDTGGGGSCVIGSRPFEFDFCPYQWVLNLMGGVIVFVAFITGLVWSGRSD
jgi:hypothetical protein